MKKYLAIVNAFWQRALTYRFTVLTHRIGEVGEMLVLILMWTAIYAGQTTFGGLTLREMLTYILVGNLFSVIIRNFLAGVVASDIHEGRLSMFLVKPMSYFSYILSREVGRMSVATLMSTLSMFIIIALFAGTFIWNSDIAYLAVVIVMVLLAFVTELLLSYLIGLAAFWTEEADGILSATDRMKRFFSGGYFPLNLLPLSFVQVSFALPFAYSFFVPAQLYLKKIDLSVGLKGLAVQLAWIVVLFLIIRITWTRGLRKYEGVGI